MHKMNKKIKKIHDLSRSAPANPVISKETNLPNKLSKFKARCNDKYCNGQDTNCLVLRSPQHRNIPTFIKLPKPAKERRTEFQFLPEERSWMDNASKQELEQIFQKCFAQLQARDKPYVVDDLKYHLKDLQAGSLHNGYLVRYSDPYNFHMIFEYIDTKYTATNAEWKSFFNQSSQVFTSAVQVFQGTSIFISSYMEFSLKTSNADLPAVQYKPGDLIIVAVPREIKGAREPHFILGYRAVVLKSVCVIDENLTQSKGLSVYLLDTGETRYVAVKYVCYLPLPFVGFPPLAVRCALHGCSPINGPWSDQSVSRMRQVVFTRGAHFFAEIFSKSFKSYPNSLDFYTTNEAYSIELTITTHPGNVTYDATSITSLLCEEGLALEWTLCPQRPALRDEPLPEEDPTREQDEALISRVELLHFNQTVPFNMVLPEALTRRLETQRLFYLSPLKFLTSFMQEYSNVLSLSINDPVLCKPSILQSVWKPRGDEEDLKESLTFVEEEDRLSPQDFEKGWEKFNKLKKL